MSFLDNVTDFGHFDWQRVGLGHQGLTCGGLGAGDYRLFD